MKRILSRSLATTACAVVAAGGILVAVPSSAFAVADTATIAPLSGTSNSTMSMSVNTSCPATAANYIITVTGGSLGAADKIVNGNTGLDAIGSTPGDGAPMSSPISKIWDQIRQDAGLASIDPGTYTWKWKCVDPLAPSTPKQVFIATQTVTTAMTSNTGAGLGAWNMPVVARDTTTTVSAAPASAGLGDTVTLTAQVTPTTGTGAATGSVQFREGTTAIGSPVALDATGKATTTVSSLAVGSHSISADFTDGAAFNASSSTTPATVTVSAGATTTTLNLPAGPNYASTPFSISATTSKPGSVTFTFTGTGAPAPQTFATSTTAPYTATIPATTYGAGSYSVKATLAPTDAANYTGSSDTQTLTVGAGAPATQVASEFIRVTVKDGSLTITVKGFVSPSPNTPSGVAGVNPTNIVKLTDAILDASGQFIVASGDLVPVIVADTRAGDLGYKVTGQLSDFVTTGGDIINGHNLGWTPGFVGSTRFPAATTAAGAGLTDGGVVAPANGVLPTDNTGTLGLKTVKTLYTAPAGASSGTVTYGAHLDLKAPTTTKPGDYQALLTLTVVP